ncbi:hypothetical protein J7T55_000305 [Diaporthe amygdali]|uniref:uncharacterized protein n=1 Tax=Phomopsis amygdali TaxID=1214568 RepID=UPI0022FF420E|nr:uncharacterized protein J7T55_000305 [Diaporthe amygdali]KAJ0109380.1 hypothetical protein J7T55_000305 [Diaporthe amygdali]
MELLTDPVQICILMGTLAYGDVGCGLRRHLGAMSSLTLLLIRRRVGEQVVNGLDCHSNPLGSVAPAFLLWDEGSVVLGGIPDERVDLLLG